MVGIFNDRWNDTYSPPFSYKYFYVFGGTIMTRDDFVFFYTSEHPFSNWYMMLFEHQSIQYNCSEQYMMYKKAMLFKDVDVAEMIMDQGHPRKQKFLGRQVRGYDDQIWMAECENIMVPGLVSKFQQDSYSRNTLLETGDKIIVEASKYDKIWGIGMEETDQRAPFPERWAGKNLLGKVLMKARDVIRS
jgi:ribA/ribD-fused uncharacterized protein